MLEALNFKGLHGQCSNDRKQILFHSRNRGVNRQIVLKVVPQLHHFPCQQECRKETAEDRRECTTLSALTPFIPKAGGGLYQKSYVLSLGKSEENPQQSLFLLLPILMTDVRPD